MTYQAGRELFKAIFVQSCICKAIFISKQYVNGGINVVLINQLLTCYITSFIVFEKLLAACY